MAFYETAEEYDKKGAERRAKDSIQPEADTKNNQLSLERFRKIGWGAGIRNKKL
jgi:hypothetical protein